MTHLTSDELIDAIEGLPVPERQAHLAACETCQRQIRELAAVLGDAQQASVPEPSPLFWQHLSARVRGAIDADPRGSSLSWWRWQLLAPLGAVALLVVALATNIRPPDVALDVAAGAAVDAPRAADSWAALTLLVGNIDLETASAAGVIEPGAADAALLELTSEEQQELTRLLEAELMRVKS
jgi:hypothetical protein